MSDNKCPTCGAFPVNLARVEDSHAKLAADIRSWPGSITDDYQPPNTREEERKNAKSTNLPDDAKTRAPSS